MSTLVPRLDHVVISVADRLDAAHARYRQLGFQLTPRGHHTLGSSNHLAIFGTDYLELLGYEPANRERAAERWGPDLNHIGFTGVAFKSLDADGDFERLAARGVVLEGDAPKAFHRPVELPDGSTPDARFRTFRLDPSAVDKGRLFFCQHLDPELVWRDVWQAHPNGVTGVSQAVLVARDPDASVALLGNCFGDALVEQIDGGWRVRVASMDLDYLVADAVRERFGDAALVPDAAAPALVALGLRSASLDQAAAHWAGEGLQGIARRDDRLVVPASEAFGVALAFEQDEAAAQDDAPAT